MRTHFIFVDRYQVLIGKVNNIFVQQVLKSLCENIQFVLLQQF